MSVAEKKSLISVEEYLEKERKAFEKSEYFQGETLMMAGASRRHNQIVATFSRFLGNALGNSSCELYINDMRLRIKQYEHYVYPDLFVTCDETMFQEQDIAIDASIIIEVLSPSTEAYDRGMKFQHYQSLPSLREYVLVSQDQIRVEIYRHVSNGKWEYTNLTLPSSSIELASIGFSRTLKDLYASVKFPDQPSGSNASSGVK